MSGRPAWQAATWALVLGCVTSAHGAPDVSHGEQVYVRCMACHALASDRVGPRHCGLFGRVSGTVPGYAYSPAMTKARITWSAVTLDNFLASPLKAVPGTTMIYDGIPEAKDREDLIAYLRVATAQPGCR